VRQKQFQSSKNSRRPIHGRILLFYVHKIVVLWYSGQGVNTFETIREIIKIKVNDRYKQPLLFDSNNEFLDPLFPEMKTLSDLYPNTFNKLSPDFGKKLQARKFFESLCVRNK